MEVTMTELALFAWAMVSTAMWMQAKTDLKFHRSMTHGLLVRVARGKIAVVKDGDSFQLKEV